MNPKPLPPADLAALLDDYDFAQRLTRLPTFAPLTRPGLRLVHPTESGCYRVTDPVGRAHSPIARASPMFAPEDGVPDLNDPATVGCLAAWCRDLYGLPMYAGPDDTGTGWHVIALYPTGIIGANWPCWRDLTDDTLATEGAAWAAAILSRLETP